MGEEFIESSPVEWSYVILMDDIIQQHVFTAQKASCIEGCIKIGVYSRSRETILPTCSAHGESVRPHTCGEFCVQLWVTNDGRNRNTI